ncbi:MAG: hypothetical protein ACUVWX_00715 [Kiritimatiellia bacterium]
MRRKSTVTLAGLLAVAALGQEFALPIRVEEPRGIERRSEPVSAGIPLPEGRFARGQPFALFEGSREIPVQVVPLVVNEQDTLRWILLDFQTDLTPKQARSFVLKAIKPVASPAARLRISETPEELDVETGRITLGIAKNKPFALFSRVEARGKRVAGGGEVSYVDGFDGRRYVADVPTVVEVEYRGDLRVTVCVRGRFAGDDKTSSSTLPELQPGRDVAMYT